VVTNGYLWISKGFAWFESMTLYILKSSNCTNTGTGKWVFQIFIKFYWSQLRQAHLPQNSQNVFLPICVAQKLHYITCIFLKLFLKTKSFLFNFPFSSDVSVKLFSEPSNCIIKDYQIQREKSSFRQTESTRFKRGPDKLIIITESD